MYWNYWVTLLIRKNKFIIMNQNVISKLDLKETDLSFGNSFIYGIKVYSYGENILMAKCDQMGEPSENILILNTKTNMKSIVTEEAINNIDKLYIEKLIISY